MFMTKSGNFRIAVQTPCCFVFSPCGPSKIYSISNVQWKHKEVGWAFAEGQHQAQDNSTILNWSICYLLFTYPFFIIKNIVTWTGEARLGRNFILMNTEKFETKVKFCLKLFKFHWNVVQVYFILLFVFTAYEFY